MTTISATRNTASFGLAKQTSLSQSEEKKIQDWFKNHSSTPSADAIEAYIKKSWSHVTKSSVHSLLHPVHEAILKVFAERNPSASSMNIQKFIKDTFKITPPSQGTIRYNKSMKWGFISQTANRRLFKDEVQKIQSWAKDNYNASVEEIQEFIEDNFYVHCSKKTILNKDWNFAICEQSRSSKETYSIADSGIYVWEQAYQIPEYESPSEDIFLSEGEDFSGQNEDIRSLSFQMKTFDGVLESSPLAESS